MEPRQPSPFATRPSRRLLYLHLFFIAVLVASTLTSCIPTTPTPLASDGAPTPTPIPEAMLTFRVSLPQELPAGDSLLLIFMDEVTGLSLNSTSYTMQALDSTHYFAIIPAAIGSVLKYRYQRTGTTFAQEHTSDGRAVRYRLYVVGGPAEVNDLVSRWTDTEFKGPSGRISGKVTDASNGKPLPNVLVTAGGEQTLTSSDGAYLLEGLPPGVHNLVAYTLDGSYQPFQQGATVAQESATPASLPLQPARFVKVTFNVSVPEKTLMGIPVRLAGNLYQLGNTFADLAGGVSTLAMRMPVLTPQENGRYSLTLSLPSGADIRYKYTLGDGLWNAEHTSGGSFRLRQLIVPDSDIVLNDTVATWSSGNSAPITFNITVPTETPAGDHVSIQFKPAYGWTEPLPMWGVPNSNRWIFILYSPLDTLGAIGYRYCRNEQCGSADNISTMGMNANSPTVNTSLLAETIDDPVTHWAWIQPSAGAVTVPNTTVRVMPQGFVTSIELQPSYQPSWQPLMASAFADIQSMHANQVTLTPTWTFTRQNLPVLEPVTGRDPLWPDLIADASLAKDLGLSLSYFPTPVFPGGAEKWWSGADRDFSWWNAWFDRYRTFLIHHADLAQQTGAASFIIGGDWAAPCLPAGTLADGSSSNVPDDAEARWRILIAEVRQHFTGKLLFALPFVDTLEAPPFLDAVDQVYLLWSAPLSTVPGASAETMAGEAGTLLDSQVLPLSLQMGKPFIIAISYPSASAASTGCILLPSGVCQSFEGLARPNNDIPDVLLNLDEQAVLYSAVLLAVNQRDWIAGVSSRGYYPPAALQDKSTSVHGKPAASSLWYWYPRMLGNVQ